MHARRCALSVGLGLVIGSVATAQPATVAAAPTWRTAVNAGLSGQFTVMTTLGVERSLRGPFAVGARGIAYTGEGFADDGGSTVGGGADLFASAATGHRFVDVRAFAGAGASVVRVVTSTLPLDPPDDPPPPGTPVPNVRPLRPHLVGGVGLDVYPLAAVGVGVEIRGVVGARGESLSTVGAGLRVRLGG